MSHILSAGLRRVLLAALAVCLPASGALALSLSTVSRPDTDSLLLQFAKPGAYPLISRTGPAEISLTFPPGVLTPEDKPEGVDFGASQFFESVRLSGDTLAVRLKTDAFGFVGWPQGERELKLQVYRDPAGANWRSPTGSQEPQTTSPPRDEAPPPKAASSLTLPVTPPNNKPGPLELPPLPATLGQGGAPAAPAAASGGVPGGEAGKEPFYAVPYSLRATAMQVPPEKAPTLRPIGMEPPAAPSATKTPSVADGAPAVPAQGGGGAGEYRVKLPPIPPAVAAGETRGAVASPPSAAASPIVAGTPEGAARPADVAAGPEKKPEPAMPPAKEEDHDANTLVAAQAEKMAGNYDAALTMMTDLKKKRDVSKDVREENLHSLAATLLDKYREDPVAHYDEIQGALLEAVNANTESFRVPEAMLHLGMLNLRAGNIPEAKGYFNVLAKKYPSDANVPLVNFYWGEYYFDRGDFKKAAEEYQTVIEKFPESKYVREGAMGLAKTLVRLGKYKEAAQIADYIGKRWPRYYVEFPQILRIDGDIAYKNGDMKKARDDYMMFYNMTPKVKDADMVFARLGDIYAKLGNRPAAVDFYNMAVKDYPDAEGGLIAKMRLAEQGVHDQPTISEMFSLFDKPAYGSPEDIYEGIIRDHPNSPLAPLAQIKLAMWLLYRQNYPDSLKAAARYLERYPKSELAPKAEEVAITAFEKMAGDLIAHKDYQRLVDAYRDNPILSANRGMLSDQTRLGLALAYLRTGKTREALAEALPYVGPRESENGMMALTMAMGVYEDQRAWRDIVELARKVQSWKFGASQRRRLEFVVAQALENLGESDRAMTIWRKLAGDQALEAGKRCYAMYFLAREAMTRKEFEKAELYAGEAAFMFKESGQDPDKRKAALNILVESTRALGQYPKALKWAKDFGEACKEGDDDWASNRLREAAILRAMGDVDGWRKTLVAMRDAAPDSLYGRMAASDLATSGLERRLNALTQAK
ncbi:tetratricopeptide repeat protein [Solidesulfovibrio sp.]|uniref:tetratricopeptide repeat protein n=1 Tax=Solidesulfovibrio sp. TaxID=2910990 RepID=UPI002623FEFF|nr:tetratricopeptide repeat protein [Solidesulfovibrio sp.]